MPTLKELVQNTKQELGCNGAEIVWCLLQSDDPGRVDADDVATAAYTYFSDSVWGKTSFTKATLIDQVLELLPYLQLQDAFRSTFDKFSNILTGCGLRELGYSDSDVVHAIAACCLLNSIQLKKLRAYGVDISEECNLTLGDLMAAAVMCGPPGIVNAGSFLHLFGMASPKMCNWEDLDRARSNLAWGDGNLEYRLPTVRSVARYFPGYTPPDGAWQGVEFKEGARVPALPWVRGTLSDIRAAAKHICSAGAGKCYSVDVTSEGYVSITFVPVKEPGVPARWMGLPYRDWTDFLTDCTISGKQSATVVFDYKPQKEAAMFVAESITWHTEGLRAVLEKARALSRWRNTSYLGYSGWKITAPTVGTDGSVRLDEGGVYTLYSDTDGNLHFSLNGKDECSSVSWELRGALGESSKLELRASVETFNPVDIDSCIDLIKEAVGVNIPALARLLPRYTFNNPDISVEVYKSGERSYNVQITRTLPGSCFDVAGEIARSASKLAQWQVYNDRAFDAWIRILDAESRGINVTTDFEEMVPCKAMVDGCDLQLGWFEEQLWVRKCNRNNRAFAKPVADAPL